jgi:disulfide bond formation protein DsbB
MNNGLLDKFASNNFRLLFASTLLISISALIGAFFAEKIGYAPCPLCIYQRYPYAMLIAICTAALMSKNCPKFWLVAVILMEFIGLALSGYHSGIELGLLPPLESCQSSINYTSMSLDEIKSHINATQATDCSKPSIVILGVSMAQWNYLFNLFLIILNGMIYFRKTDNAKTVL